MPAIRCSAPRSCSAGPLQAETVRLETGVGVIPVRLEREGARIVFGRMTQPVPTWEPFAQTDELLAALGVERSELPVEVYDNGLKYVYVVLSSADDVARLEPDLRRLGALPEVLGTNCLAGSGGTWKTRMFAPADGVPEDPATGRRRGRSRCTCSATGSSAPAKRSRSPRARAQAPVTLYATAWGTPEQIERVEVAGSAVVVARGEFQL